MFFNTDDSKYFLSTKSEYYNDFSRIMWHWRLEKWCWNSALPSLE